MGLERPESLLGDETVEPMAGMVGQETDEAEPLAEEFRVETSEEIVLRSSGGGEFQVPDASQELVQPGAGTSPSPRSAATGRRGAGEEPVAAPSPSPKPNRPWRAETTRRCSTSGRCWWRRWAWCRRARGG